MTMLIDAHAHLDFADYGSDLPAVIQRAKEAGLVHVVLVGQWGEGGKEGPAGMAAARGALDLSRTDPAFFSATAGIHPHDAARASAEDLRELEAICAESGVVAVGECGLDYHYDRSPREAQRERFVEQIRLARRLKKPLVVHTREADEDTATLLEKELGPEGGIIHCFTGDWRAAQNYLALGLYISLSGVLTFKAADALRDAARRIPLERLLVETDCPFLAPVPHRGKRNEPAYVAFTAARLAELRDAPLSDVERATTENARRAFRLNAVTA
jgi:TatD DNase family protein